MIIKNIIWFDRDNSEAELLIKSSKFDFKVFSHPCNYEVGDILQNPLFPLEHMQLMLSDNKTYHLEKIPTTHFGYKINGVVKNRKDGLIKVGDVELCLNEELPEWANEGKYVEFICPRIDT